uniref:Uncharacterized protein n=1 Tax=Arcella intermedia TaxID=1963864 RepID=A0A6B2LM53_9EUKA
MFKTCCSSSDCFSNINCSSNDCCSIRSCFLKVGWSGVGCSSKIISFSNDWSWEVDSSFVGCFLTGCSSVGCSSKVLLISFLNSNNS